ncbi:NAD-dependent epimerase/dehydratase family protein [Paraliomyxa miuraensis]|uniref:NAD-dependent epimerase/dehydratase family protein n=1 Tax=Paraliomyxa miuraensis TaxID=376150 RepID=UPI0022532CB0|nr:NAD-dependent epimerase/dehydratase family protein [Paraliomyxa miuraensis]MCX4247825.1 NAD-dependent epimerase/dehydratase family protein [Paraliomyxa miuraensis]
MQHALVTGAPGFLGAHIVQALVQRGVRVRGWGRPGEPCDHLRPLAKGSELEMIEGDVRDPALARRAVEGIDTVFHAAAVYESWAPDPTLMYDVNMRGTFNVLCAAREVGARVVYTASVVALGRPAPGVLADEDTPYEAWDLDFPYSRSKYHSMRLAEDFAAWGLDVRIVCPGYVMGPGDRTPTPSGQLLIALAQGKAPGYTAGGIAYVDVRDAALGHVSAAERGRPGRRYVVSGHNIDNAMLIRIVARAAGRRPIAIPLPKPVARGAAAVLQRAAVARGRRPDLATVMLEYGMRECFYDNRRAREELGLRFRPFEDTVADGLTWFREAGML